MYFYKETALLLKRAICQITRQYLITIAINIAGASRRSNKGRAIQQVAMITLQIVEQVHFHLYVSD